MSDSNAGGLMLLTPHTGDTVSVRTFYSCAANGTNKVQVQTGSGTTYQAADAGYYVGTVGNGTNTSPYSNVVKSAHVSAPVMSDSNADGLMLLTPHTGDTVSVYTFYSCAANGTNKVQVQTGSGTTYQAADAGYYVGTVGNGTSTSSYSNIVQSGYVVAPMLRAGGVSQLFWTWPGTNPLFWNVMASADGATNWTAIDPQHLGDGYDGNDRQGVIGLLWPGGQYYLIVGVNGQGDEVTPRSNILPALTLTADGFDLYWTFGADQHAWRFQYQDELAVWNDVSPDISGDARDKSGDDDPHFNSGTTIRLKGIGLDSYQSTLFSNEITL